MSRSKNSQLSPQVWATWCYEEVYILQLQVECNSHWVKFRGDKNRWAYHFKSEDYGSCAVRTFVKKKPEQDKPATKLKPKASGKGQKGKVKQAA